MNSDSKEKCKYSLLLLTILSTVLTISSLRVTFAAQEPEQKQTQPDVRPAPADMVIASSEDYRIGVGDVIIIQIEKAPELSGTFRVSSGGTITMQFLGRLSVQQKTPEELGTTIANGLRGRYLTNPHVNVTVSQFNSRTFFIQGAVNKPGVFQIEARPSLLKLITLAGGLTKDHGSTAFIIREVKATPTQNAGAADPAGKGVATEPAPGPTNTGSSQASGDEAVIGAKYDLISININGLYHGRFDQNIVIEPGDIVNIPTTDIFFVAGEVHSPGSFPLKEGTTLRQAISLAQGTTFEAAKGRGLIFRENTATGAREEIKVDVGAVMDGKKDDITIMPNDVIILPNSRFKTMSNAILKGFGLNMLRIPGRY
jgi:polysaccharide biosynthesis/export protein